jgi:predicted chitinase
MLLNQLCSSLIKINLWDICDRGVNEDSMLKLTKRINGGTNGLEHRKASNNKVL